LKPDFGITDVQFAMKRIPFPLHRTGVWSVVTGLLIVTLADADVVTDWNAAALNAIRGGHTAPPIASRSLAILHVSIYDAVNGIARTHESYLVPGAAPASASREAAASAAAWDAKYVFDFWRPVTAINFAEPQLNWTSFIVTPPFPDYVSGHSTFSGAAATVLEVFYGTEDLPFTTGSDFLPGMYRSFSTCLDAAEEAAMSRIYAGIHFRSASEDGLQAGIRIGEWTATHYLQPKGNRSRR
jgi:membrane-associated phospholipid phosphatase